MKPSKVRVTRMNEGQLNDLVAIEEARAAEHHAHGHDDVTARGLRDIAQLTKRHNVRVCEADEKPAGYLAWRDESPGVAYIEDLVVPEERQEHGVGEKLVEAMREEARGLKLPYVLVRSPSAAPWTPGFYAKSGFSPVDADAPDVVKTWQKEQTAGGKPLAGEGIAVLWAKI
jgi:amino-acid N-acetyltransferase